MLNVDQKIILITRLSYYYLEIFQLEMCLLNITMETHHPLWCVIKQITSLPTPHKHGAPHHSIIHHTQEILPSLVCSGSHPSGLTHRYYPTGTVLDAESLMTLAATDKQSCWSHFHYLIQ